ncbi:MAG: PD40 domain-containing protein [Deltaproteobacteria bacterium]|nr:PD40 domain-containing protein [Deltaproteobacteria bacterium]MBI3294870.1 PD40 domain-containing protein [Deltaproteobacteria bacterium]
MRLAFILLFLSVSCFADVYITVTGAQTKRAQLALGRLHQLPDSQKPEKNLAAELEEQIRDDLEFMGLFDFTPPGKFAQLDKPQDIEKLKYEEWRAVGSTFVLKVGYRLKGKQLALEASLYDIPGQKRVFGTRYQHSVDQYSRLVHALSEEILKSLTGEKGLYFSRVAMICRTPPKNGRPGSKELFVVGTDGGNVIRLTADNTITLSPAWSPDGKYISYTQFDLVSGNRMGTVLKKHKLSSGQREVLSARDGMNSGANWAPDGKRIAMTLSYNGRPELYLLPSEGGEPEPLSRMIQWRRVASDGFQPNLTTLLFDVEPYWSPTSDKLVFSSARTGHPMIYIVDVATKVATQLTFAGQYNATPAWSPRGDKIVFAAQRTGEGNFDLYEIDTDGNNLQRLTSGDNPTGKRFNNENPSWGPTGRHLAYSSSEGGQYSVYIMNVDGTFRRKISPPGSECSMPAWGPADG